MLLTKVFAPCLNPKLLRRSRFFDLLNKGLKRKLILISAAAGYGKTSLIADWMHHTALNAFWFSLDENDQDATMFFRNLIASVQRVYPEFGLAILELIQSSEQLSNTSVTTLIINEFYKFYPNEDALIVLDDYHLIDSPEISEIVIYLLEHLPETIHLVMVTRSDPMFPLAR